MKVAVTGSEGYLGTSLVGALRARHDVLRVDALLWGQPGEDVVRASTLSDIWRAIEEFGPEVTVHLAALAHDPAGKLNSHLVQVVNAEVPAMVAQRCLRRGVRFVGVSSFSVFAGPNCGAYPESKRRLEDNLCDLGLWRGASFVRLGTLFGADEFTRTYSYRPHLLLNSMVLSALHGGGVEVRNPGSMRPVCPLAWAVSGLCSLVEDPVPGVVQNLHLCSAPVLDYARFVASMLDAKVLTNGGHPADPRSYSFAPLLSDKAAAEMLHHELGPLVDFTRANLKELVRRRAKCWDDYYARASEMSVF